MIEYSSTVLLSCLWLGAITTIFSSLIGLFQQDIKKIIAYSTMSQLARENNINYVIFRHQTKCVSVILKIINSQITKAHEGKQRKLCLSMQELLRPLIILVIVFLIHFSLCGSTYLCDQIMSVKWKIIIIRKLVGISEAIRLTLICFFFNLLYFFTGMWTNYFSARKSTFLSLRTKFESVYESEYLSESGSFAFVPDPFFEWLAGVIDGDGHFNLSKSGTARFTITMDIRDKKALYEIKHKLGGSIYTMANANALRYQLSHRKGLIVLLNGINGLIRNPTRMLQMNKLCVKYGIELIYPKPLTFNNGWLSGFIDSDGSVYFSEQSGQVFISASQKNKYLLEPLINIYGGRVDIVSPKVEAFKYIVYRKKELFNLVDNYFDKYPLKTKKCSRVNLIKEFYLLRIYINSKDISKFNEWISFKDKWEKYKD